MVSVLVFNVGVSFFYSQGVAQVWIFWDLSRPLGSLDETYKTSSIAGWLTSIRQDGEVLALPRGRLWN